MESTLRSSVFFLLLICFYGCSLTNGQGTPQGQPAANSAPKRPRGVMWMPLDVIGFVPEQFRPQDGDNVTMQYTAMLADGKKIDSSMDRKEPFSFIVGAGQIIEGLDTAIRQATTGQRSMFEIPWEYAYGERGVFLNGKYIIPPKTDMLFFAKITSIMRPQRPRMFPQIPNQATASTPTRPKV